MELISKDKCIMGRPLNKKDMVFAIFYCDDEKPYADTDKYIKEGYKDKIIPLVLSQFRIQDGKIGFVGGRVEETDKTLLDALIRECKEEMNISVKNINSFVPFATFADEKTHISSYLCKCTYKELLFIVKNSQKSEHYGIENSGTIILHLHDKAIDNILKHNFSGTAKEELKLLLNKFFN